MVRGRVWVPPAAGMSPSFASGIAKEASVDAMRRSQRRAISSPEPMQWPWMAATRGLFEVEEETPEIAAPAGVPGGDD